MQLEAGLLLFSNITTIRLPNTVLKNGKLLLGVSKQSLSLAMDSAIHLNFTVLCIQKEISKRGTARNRTTISNYFYYLEQAFLIKKLYNYSPNLLTSEKKMKKVYPAATAFFYYSGQWPPDLSHVFENSIVLETRSDFFYRDNYKNEVDIIVPLDAPAAGKRPRLVPVEVKFSDAVKPKALKPIQLFMNRNKVSSGIIITKNTGKEVSSDDLHIRFIPGWQFALEKEKIYSDLHRE